MFDCLANIFGGPLSIGSLIKSEYCYNKKNNLVRTDRGSPHFHSNNNNNYT